MTKLFERLSETAYTLYFLVKAQELSIDSQMELDLVLRKICSETVVESIYLQRYSSFFHQERKDFRLPALINGEQVTPVTFLCEGCAVVLTIITCKSKRLSILARI